MKNVLLFSFIVLLEENWTFLTLNRTVYRRLNNLNPSQFMDRDHSDQGDPEGRIWQRTDD